MNSSREAPSKALSPGRHPISLPGLFEALRRRPRAYRTGPCKILDINFWEYFLPRTRVNKAYTISNKRTAAEVRRYGARPKGNLAAISGGTCSATVSAPSHTRRHKASS